MVDFVFVSCPFKRKETLCVYVLHQLTTKFLRPSVVPRGGVHAAMVVVFKFFLLVSQASTTVLEKRRSAHKYMVRLGRSCGVRVSWGGVYTRLLESRACEQPVRGEHEAQKHDVI